MILLIVSVLLPRDVLFAQDGDGSFTPGEVRRDPMGFEMVYVPGATFEIGITPDRLREVCRDRGEDDLDHCVEVMEEDAGATFRETMVIPPFWIDRYEVTGEQFETVCQTMASSVRGSFPTFYFETCCA
jgi:formylglycine-generating enzyme required for sulfatase activity